MSSQVTPAQLSNTHPIAHIPGTYDFTHLVSKYILICILYRVI